MLEMPNPELSQFAWAHEKAVGATHCLAVSGRYPTTCSSLTPSASRHTAKGNSVLVTNRRLLIRSRPRQQTS
jgi:hypothetical protein